MNWKKYGWVIIIGVIAVVAVIGGIVEDSNSSPAQTNNIPAVVVPTQTASVTTPTSAPAITPIPVAPATPTPKLVTTHPPAPAKTWHIVATFSGSGQENTAPFTIQGSQWRIDWTETLSQNPLSFCEQNNCNMFVYIYHTGQTDGNWSDQFSTANLQNLGTATGTNYEYIGAGTFYIATNPDLINQWALTIEDYY